jgi:hypothetical protein
MFSGCALRRLQNYIKKIEAIAFLAKNIKSVLLKLKNIASLKGQFQRKPKKSFSNQEEWVFTKETKLVCV